MIILTVLYYGGSLVTTDVISVGNLTSFILYAAYVGIGKSATYICFFLYGFTSAISFFRSVVSKLLIFVYLFTGFNGVSTFYAEMMKALGASSRLWDIVDRSPMISLNQGLVPEIPLTGNIRFDKVDFSYPTRSDIKVLSDFSLNVPADHVMAVVGGSGSGMYCT